MPTTFEQTLPTKVLWLLTYKRFLPKLQHFCILINSFAYLKLDPWALYSVTYLVLLVPTTFAQTLSTQVLWLWIYKRLLRKQTDGRKDERTIDIEYNKRLDRRRTCLRMSSMEEVIIQYNATN